MQAIHAKQGELLINTRIYARMSHGMPDSTYDEYARVAETIFDGLEPAELAKALFAHSQGIYGEHISQAYIESPDDPEQTIAVGWIFATDVTDEDGTTFTQHTSVTLERVAREFRPAELEGVDIDNLKEGA